MRNFYIRLAISNITKNKPVYCAVLFNKCFICNGFLCYGFNPKTRNHSRHYPGSYIFIQFLKIGVILTGLFAGVFLLYTNQLLIRQRKKYLGLYSILSF